MSSARSGPHRLGIPRETARRPLASGKIFDVVRCALRYRDGRSAAHDLVIHGGAAVFVPIPRPGRVLLVRQYRHAARRRLWEVPAGRLERGERPLTTARRELAEECGLRASSWERVTSFWPVPGYATEVMHLYFARGLSPAAPGAEPDDDEDIETREFTHAELFARIASGEIIDGKTLVAAFFLARGAGARRVRKRSPRR